MAAVMKDRIEIPVALAVYPEIQELELRLDDLEIAIRIIREIQIDPSLYWEDKELGDQIEHICTLYGIQNSYKADFDKFLSELVSQYNVEIDSLVSTIENCNRRINQWRYEIWCRDH